MVLLDHIDAQPQDIIRSSTQRSTLTNVAPRRVGIKHEAIVLLEHLGALKVKRSEDVPVIILICDHDAGGESATEREDVHDVMVGEEARVLEVVERSEHVEGSSVLCQ